MEGFDVKSLGAKLLAVVLAGSAMAGCETVYGPVAQDEDSARCRAFGYRTGTRGHSACMEDLYFQRERRTAAQNDLLVGALVGAAVVGTAVAISDGHHHHHHRRWCGRYRRHRC